MIGLVDRWERIIWVARAVHILSRLITWDFVRTAMVSLLLWNELAY